MKGRGGLFFAIVVNLHIMPLFFTLLNQGDSYGFQTK